MSNFSIVVPIFNEADNIYILYKDINSSMSSKNLCEIIFVNDGSKDKTKEILNDLSGKISTKIVSHSRNLGQSRAILSGVKEANYDTIVTMDGDGQNDPRDIFNLLKEYFSSKDLSLVGGIRVKRNDSFVKIISSIIANRIRSYILKDECLDTGCGLKVFSRDIFLTLPFFDGIHRFLPALFKGIGCKTSFINVRHRPRIRGLSKYGIFDRLFKGIIDIIRVRKIIRDYNIKKI